MQQNLPGGGELKEYLFLQKEEKMAKEKKFVEAITSMEEDFAQWYTDVVKKAELIEYSTCLLYTSRCV